jgi:hypothetical protein
MRIIAAIFTIIWTGFWFFIGISSLLVTPKQINKDKNFVDTKLKPAVEFTKQFKKDSGRLPNNREFYNWEREYYNDYSSDLTQKSDSLIPDFGTVQYIRHTSDVIDGEQWKFKSADWKKDFSIGVWRGEWMEYYYSWDNSYDTNNYSWRGAYISLFAYCLLGLLPFIFWWRFYNQRKKSST